MRRDSVKWLRAGLGDFAIVGCWWRKKTGLALLLCTSSVTKSIYKSLYSLGNWATYLGIQFESETCRSSIFQNVPWCSVPTDSCGYDRINQVLYRQEGSWTFCDFPRGLRDLLQSVAQICTVYILFRAKCEVHWRDNTPVTSRFEKKVLDFRCFSPFFSALMIKNAKKMGKKNRLQLLNPALHSSKLSHNL